MAKKRALHPGEMRPSLGAVEGEAGGRGAGAKGAEKREVSRGGRGGGKGRGGGESEMGEASDGSGWTEKE